MASIEKRVSGWRVKIRLKGVSESESFRTKAEASAWAARREAEINAASRGAIPNKTVGDLLERYIDEVTPKKVSPKAETLRLRRLVGLSSTSPTPKVAGPREPDPLAAVRLADLNSTHISAWRDRRLLIVSSSSVRRELNSLSAAFNHAVREWKWLHQNPCHGVQKPADSVPRHSKFSDDAVERILVAAGYDREQIPLTETAKVGAALLFALETAMREGEIARLRPERVDLACRLVRLNEVDERVVGRFRTKNGTSREVPLSLEAIRILNQLLPGVSPGETIFGMNEAVMSTLFTRIRRRALVEGLTFHDARRTALTRMAAKVDVMTLAKISGHRDLRVLLDTYYKPDMSEIAGKLD